ncbi:hypothetical protein RF11_05078 [Thelohanellus kitauei]|uniref:Uncharacterized protein n=1 Tax=Thelohanellus kitauei TaxID=669202 RepID=A0A0C2NB88_THEKT|nr:hypothetical protein RF11_05078 [Thelohanellus kitauei]
MQDICIETGYGLKKDEICRSLSKDLPRSVKLMTIVPQNYLLATSDYYTQQVKTGNSAVVETTCLLNCVELALGRRRIHTPLCVENNDSIDQTTKWGNCSQKSQKSIRKIAVDAALDARI